MDYLKIYNSLVDRAKTRKLDGYKERHHIKPKCIGGDNSKSNIVEFTPEEHYLAHLLLVKIYPKNRKLVYAANMLCVDSWSTNRSNKRYGWLRKRLANTLSKQRKGKPAANKGVPITEEHRAKISTTWIFTFPDGREETHIGLNQFCKLHGLNPSTMSSVCKGIRSNHKGFKCRKLDNISQEDNKEFVPTPHKGWKEQRNRIKVLINGVEYDSVYLASVDLGITRNKVKELNEYNLL